MPFKTQTPTADLESSTESLRALSSYLSASPCPLLKFASGRTRRTSRDTFHKRYAQGALLRGRASLRQLRDLRDAVSSLQLAVEGAVTTLESAVRPYILHNGIKSLPNEVLVMIFEQVYELGKTDIDAEDLRFSNLNKTDFVDWRVPVHLSHVDRRFRSVAIKCPGLWTSISYCYRRDMIKMFLQRSGRRAGLTINLDVETPKALLKDITAVSRRWKSVIIQGRLGFLSLSSKDKLWPFNFSVNLPSVESLTTVVENGFNLPDKLFDLRWQVPNLKYLSAYNCSPFSPPNGGTNVTFLDLSLCNAGGYFISSDSIVTKLRQTPNLTHLSLSLKLTHVQTSDYPPVELPNLTSLSMELQQFSGAEFLKKIIVAKNVRTINVVLHVESRYTATIWNEDLFLGSQEIFPDLQEISYVECVPDDIRGSTINDILHLLSKWETLEHIVLDTPSFLSDSSEQVEECLPALRSLSLRRCHASINQHLEKILKESSTVYNESNGARGLKALEIIGCPDIDMAKVSEFVPKDRLSVLR